MFEKSFSNIDCKKSYPDNYSAGSHSSELNSFYERERDNVKVYVIEGSIK